MAINILVIAAIVVMIRIVVGIYRTRRRIAIVTIESLIVATIMVMMKIVAAMVSIFPD